MALAVLCTGTARGAGPTYSADGIVNASNFTAGPFAPNSVITIFGSGLARLGASHALAGSDLVKCATSGGICLPLELDYVRVYVHDQPAPLLFVSEKQINFLIPNTLLPGPVTVRVVVDSLRQPEDVTVTLVDAAPALFPMPGEYCIATAADGTLLTADAPSHANDTVVVYVTGLGLTSPNPGLAEIPNYQASITPAALASLKVALNGTTLDPVRIKYAGVTPGSAGLYQINILLPDGTGPDPEIRVSLGNLPAQTGLKLALR